LDEYFGTSSERSSRISTITTNIREQAVTPMRAMVTAYNDFIAELRNLSSGDAPLQVALTALGTTLGGTQTLAVRNAAVNAQINVEVRIEAQQLVTALHSHTTRETSAANRRFKGTAFTVAANGNN